MESISSQSANDIFDEVSVGTCFNSDSSFKVTPGLTKLFAQAVNDESPWFLEEGRHGGVIAPPMFGIVPATLLLIRAIADGRLPLKADRAVHGEQDMSFLSPIRPGDVLVTQGQLAGKRHHSSGTSLNFEFLTTTHAGEERVRQHITTFVKDLNDPDRPRPRRTKTPRRAPNMSVGDASMTVAPDQTYRYAKASFTQGIAPHEDPACAQAMGYRTVFLQGQCTLAFAAKAVVDTMCGGDPTRLRRLKARFTKVAYPGDVLTSRIYRSQLPGRYSLEMHNQDGELVLSESVAEIDS